MTENVKANNNHNLHKIKIYKIQKIISNYRHIDYKVKAILSLNNKRQVNPLSITIIHYIICLYGRRLKRTKDGLSLSTINKYMSWSYELA